ncbi:ATP-binding cassette domain-containing protein [Haloferax sp. MBLA0076]|uniref:ATP-binding cassette domain-containing protein n=1 Tax=Haloferax litoreum TaxID=2666140 RepID=A0A6A8GKV7_9EURY|nr:MULTISPECIES: ABC transporter ATP-binding protein [Haloferax]KAB1190436.1 ABC transporter ATP-binding protein [Haloferax sp. CBA1148]MRX23411.1 ATP-binding cassette domain-containing protein [Haloferax litoreum]
MTDEPILEVRDLRKYFAQNRSLGDMALGRKKDKIQAVDDVSFDLRRNEVKGIIGESGCGKTTLLMTLLGLHEKSGGEILFNGRDYSEFDKEDWKRFRRSVQVIFQDPFDSLDPKMTVKQTLEIPLEVHGIGDREERIRDTLDMVELRPADRYIDRYPNQLSGGEKQRVSIARALILEPDIILADEPVSMLDVSTQAVILKLLSKLTEEQDVSMIYISHDLSTVSYVCDEINVMYLGRIVETAPTMDLLRSPKHPYAEALINAIPVPNPHKKRERTDLEGSTPDPIGLGEGCRFRDRCPERMPICDTTPKYLEVESGRRVACHLHYDHESLPRDTNGDAVVSKSTQASPQT